MKLVAISKSEGNVYHEEFCPYIKRMKSGNKKFVRLDYAKDHNYRPCKFCSGVKGIVYYFKTNEKEADISYDKIDDAMCIKTKTGFWKLFYRARSQDWHLFHMNHKGYKSFNPNLKPKVLMRGSFHRQEDFKPTVHPGKALTYIKSHDKNYGIAETDIRRLPKNTAKQRVHYRQQKCRKKRESIKNVYKIFDELERKKG